MRNVVWVKSMQISSLDRMVWVESMARLHNVQSCLESVTINRYSQREYKACNDIHNLHVSRLSVKASLTQDVDTEGADDHLLLNTFDVNSKRYHLGLTNK